MKFIEITETSTGLVHYINIDTIATLVPTQSGSHTNVYLTTGGRVCVGFPVKDLTKALQKLGHEVKNLSELTQTKGLK